MSHTHSWDYHTSPVGSLLRAAFSSLIEVDNKKEDAEVYCNIERLTIDLIGAYSVLSHIGYRGSCIKHLSSRVLTGHVQVHRNTLHYFRNWRNYIMGIIQTQIILSLVASQRRNSRLLLRGSIDRFARDVIQILKWLRSIPNQLRDTSPLVQLSGRA